MIGNYVLDSQIGEGQFGQIFRSRHLRTKCPVAIKVIKKAVYQSNQQLLTQLGREIKIMRKLRHPNLMRLHEFFQSSRHYYIVMDLCPEGDLLGFMARRQIGHFFEQEALLLLTHIKRGFGQLRRLHVVHRDLKLANILVKDGHLLIADFGTSKIFNGMTTTTVGTPVNMSPEVLRGEPYNHKSDMWALGVIFFRLLFGKVPFNGVSIGSLLVQITKHSGQHLRIPEHNSVCPAIQSVLKRLLEPDQTRRMSWSEFQDHYIFSSEHRGQCPCFRAKGRADILKKFAIPTQTGNNVARARPLSDC